MSNKDRDSQEIKTENQIDDSEYEEEEEYEEDESYQRYEPPKPKTKEELIAICEQKISGCKERIISTNKTILKA